MNKIIVFENELNYIKDLRIRKELEKFINIIPDYFFEIAASSSGKYHPSYALGKGGLVRHTKAALKIANCLLRNDSVQNFSDNEKDLIYFALLIHDSFKSGRIREVHTKIDHPLIVAEVLDEVDSLLKADEIAKIKAMVSSHMGQWNKDYMGIEILPKPEGELAKFVHLCDYLASQKFIVIDFN